MNSTNTKTINSIFVRCPGDPSVGIPGSSATISGDGDFIINLDCLDEEDRKPHLAEIRKKVSELFTLIWDEPATVEFDFERAMRVDSEEYTPPPEALGHGQEAV